MLIEIDFNSDEAIYIQLYNQIVMAIATCGLEKGEELPSVRRMAEDIGVNMHTVNKAYAVLRQDGFIRLDRRKGAVVETDPDRERAKEEMRDQMKFIVAKGICKGVTMDEAGEILREIYAQYEGDD